MADRLTVSDAIEAVGRMVRGYPNKEKLEKSYIGAIAELLCRYPKAVALACADPFHGVVRYTKFMPTPADVIAFCERRAEPLHKEADREKRVTAQLDARDEWQNEPVSPRLKAMAESWLNRTDPKAAVLTSVNADEQAARKQAGMAKIEAANRQVFERECKAAGIDPAGGVSPALRKLLEK